MEVFTCNDNLTDIFTCIYDAWDYAIHNGGHENVRLEKEPVLQLSLFDNVHHVNGDMEKSISVEKSIKKKISVKAYNYISYAAMSHERDCLDAIYNYLRLGFKVGAQVVDDLREPVVIRLIELSRNVSNEAHFSREFLRFNKVSGAFVAHYEPKSNIILFAGEHFADRMPGENFMIVDDNRRIAVVHPKNEGLYLRSFTEEEFKSLKDTEKYNDQYTDLWKVFFDAIAIKERTNYICQRSHFPLWMRKHVTEFK